MVFGQACGSRETPLFGSRLPPTPRSYTYTSNHLGQDLRYYLSGTGGSGAAHSLSVGFFYYIKDCSIRIRVGPDLIRGGFHGSAVEIFKHI